MSLNYGFQQHKMVHKGQKLLIKVELEKSTEKFIASKCYLFDDKNELMIVGQQMATYLTDQNKKTLSLITKIHDYL